MPSIAHIQSQLKEFDTSARKASQAKDPETALQKAWKRIFSMNLDAASAKSFARYYREMRSKSRSMRGGSNLHPASLSYQIVPAVQAYGKFPMEADTDPATIRDLDIYFQDSLTKSCGIDSSRQVPADMGSNKVGGRRSRRVNRKNRNTYKKQKKNRKSKRKNTLKSSRKLMRGGNMLETLMSRPYLATVPSGVLQTVGTTWNASPQEPSGSPVEQAWHYKTLGTERLVDPGLVTPIEADLTTLVKPAPWQTSH
jgi:hypothetical protein